VLRLGLLVVHHLAGDLMLDRLACRYGRRGAWLIVLGSVWCFFGVGVLLDPTAPRSWVAYEYAPVLVHAAAWWVTGGVALWQGMRGPNRTDTPGHVALYVMPAIRVLSFTLSWLIWLGSTALVAAGVCETTIGWAGGWYAALVWSLVSVMLRLIADWPNPRRPIPHPPADAMERS
jgi:hypothetical protein